MLNTKKNPEYGMFLKTKKYQSDKNMGEKKKKMVK